MNFKLRIAIFAIAAIFAAMPLHAQLRLYGRGYFNARIEVNGADTLQVVDLLPIFVFANPLDQQKFLRHIENVKKVYPLAKEAQRRVGEMEQHMATIPDPVTQRAYIKRMERELVREYTPVLTRLTFQQGKILIKLIDRETKKTSYAIVRDMLGGVSAGIWQGIALLFGANLNQGYDKTGEDKMIEEVIILYEHGMI